MMKLRERLAELEHAQWMHWTTYYLDNDILENRKRWRKQTKMPYYELSESEKESDRDWADKTIIIFRNRLKKVLSKHTNGAIAEQIIEEVFS